MAASITGSFTATTTSDEMRSQKVSVGISDGGSFSGTIVLETNLNGNWYQDATITDADLPYRKVWGDARLPRRLRCSAFTAGTANYDMVPVSARD